MARYVLIETATGIVENVVNWEGNTSVWAPPVGYSVRLSDEASPGDTWNGTKFVKDTTPPVVKLGQLAFDRLQVLDLDTLGAPGTIVRETIHDIMRTLGVRED